MRAIQVYIALMSLTCAGMVSAQVKENSYDEIRVVGLRILVPTDSFASQTIGELNIAELQPDDLGHLLQKFSGANVKNYGGQGSLKLLNFRGLGGQHTRVLMDGFQSIDAQSGQLNFAQVPTTNIKLVRLGDAHSSIYQTPLSMIGGQVLSLTTNLGVASVGSTAVIQSNMGSFGLFDQSIQLGFTKKRVGVQSFFRFRQYAGEYPFNVASGNFNFVGQRSPTDLKELYGGLGLSYQLKNGGQSRLIYRTKRITQQLPGSIVLYNNVSEQFLNTEKHQVSWDLVLKKKKWQFRPFMNMQFQTLNYLDQQYQNMAGFLEQNFVQLSTNAGFNSLVSLINNKLSLIGGVEHQMDQLTFAHDSNRTVLRHQILLIENLVLRLNRSVWKLKLGTNAVLDLPSNTKASKQTFLPNGGIEWSRKRLSTEWLEVKMSSQYSYRLPSFNELYFGQVGNQDLLPEKAFQNSLGIGFSNHSKQFPLQLKLIGYANWVTNKIVAIPTKSLFVWSIQNVDEVRVLGGDLRAEGTQMFSKDFKTVMGATYSYQNAQNRTPGSISFGDQIAYIPLNSGNVDVSAYYKNIGMRWSNFLTGKRFALNQNNGFNQISGFGMMDLSIFYKLKIKEIHDLHFQLSIKNLTNQSVEFVRGFTMPGRNFLMSINYEI